MPAATSFSERVRELIEPIPYVNTAAKYLFHRVLAEYDKLGSPNAGDALGLVRRRWTGAVPAGSSRMLCAFAHFDAANELDDYVIHYLRALREQLGAETIAVSTAEELSDEAVAPALPWVSEFVVRRNVGLDFGSWKVALVLRPDLSAYDRVLLANDSVYGPIHSLAPMLAKLPQGRPAVLGMTDSYEVAYHLQSYFLAFNREAVASQLWRRFWTEFVFYRDRRNVIRQYEIGLSKRALREGMELVPAFPYTEVAKRARTMSLEPRVRSEIEKRPVNPTLHLWRVLLEGMDFPFLKGELLKTNPNGAELGEVPDLIARTSEYPFGLIRGHLERAGRVRFYT